MTGKSAVFLDRDGVVNRAILRDGRPHPPETLDALEILPGVIKAVQRFKQAGLLVIVVTNQPDLARGHQLLAVVDAMHRKIRSVMPLDAIFLCPHDDSDDCPCRKPKPGMLVSASQHFVVDPALSFMVGDRWRDISAGKAAGCRTFLIGDGYGEMFPDTPDATFASLWEACDPILNEAGRR